MGGLGDKRGEMGRSGYNQISCTHFLNSQRIEKILFLKVKKEISLFFLSILRDRFLDITILIGSSILSGLEIYHFISFRLLGLVLRDMIFCDV